MQILIDCPPRAREGDTALQIGPLHPHKKLYLGEILLRGWIGQMTSLSQCTPSGLSCCHLTHNLILNLFMPGVFVAIVVWLYHFVATAESIIESSRRNDILENTKPTGKYLLLSREESTTWLTHPIWEETCTRWLLHQSHSLMMTQMHL